MKILVVASLTYSLLNFRGALLQRMVAEGHEVLTCAPDDDPAVVSELAAMGISFRQVPIDRTGLNPLRDLRTLSRLIGLMRSERPQVVLAYTQKPIVYAGIAARLTGARFHAMVSGLGHPFSPGGGIGRICVRAVLSALYRVAVKRADRVFLFNGDDEAELRRYGILRHQRVVQVPGSGVDTQRFAFHPVPASPPIFLMICRLLRDKGLAEFVAAARIVKERCPEARFQILGPLDPNPTGVGRSELDGWIAAGDVEYLGETRDVVPFLASATVFVLPSYYREGLPKAILEAMSVGRPVVTTDMPGCREPIEPERNGILVPARDAEALATALLRFVENPALAATMGKDARAIAEKVYDVRKVNELLITEMGIKGSGPAPPPVPRKRALGDRSVLELGLSAVASIAAAPLIVLIAGLVVVTMGRPVFFRQIRMGAAGRPFTIIKFRTMRDTRNAQGSLLPDEERTTPLGRFLRRSRFDELPELWNVLKRDMSIVGPRPLLPETVAAMGEAGLRRGEVRPGVTGWAQIHGNVLLSDADKLVLDLWYVANRSLALDVRIAFATVATIAMGEKVDHGQIRRAYASAADRSC